MLERKLTKYIHNCRLKCTNQKKEYQIVLVENSIALHSKANKFHTFSIRNLPIRNLLLNTLKFKVDGSYQKVKFFQFYGKNVFSFFNVKFYVDFEFRIRNNLHYSQEGEKSLSELFELQGKSYET